MTRKRDKTVNPYAMRIEYRLCRNNNDYLHIDNLKGSVDDVIKKYTPLLGVIHHNFFSEHIEVTGTYNKHFNKVLKEAEKGGGKNRRYRNGRLKKSTSIPQSPLRSDTEGKERVQMELRRVFLEEMKNAQNDRK